MKLAICNVCGSCFIPQKGYEKTCDECYFMPRKAKPVFCEIEEHYGRCDGYMKGICEACLDFCAAEDWVGWRAVNGCEWWQQRVGTACNSDGQSNGTSIYQETHSGICGDFGPGESELRRREILDIFSDGANIPAL